MPCKHQWETAISWVQTNQALVGYISAPYRKYMASNAKDIEQEAMLAAFCALKVLSAKNEDSSKFGAYFRVQFRTRCIKMANGGMRSIFDNIEEIPSAIPPEQKKTEPDHKIIEHALMKMTNRQRQISGWVLDQPTPVSTTIIAKEFGIHGRTVRNILCNAIRRVESKKDENNQICKDISPAT